MSARKTSLASPGAWRTPIVEGGPEVAEGPEVLEAGGLIQQPGRRRARPSPGLVLVLVVEEELEERIVPAFRVDVLGHLPRDLDEVAPVAGGEGAVGPVVAVVVPLHRVGPVLVQGEVEGLQRDPLAREVGEGGAVEVGPEPPVPGRPVERLAVPGRGAALDRRRRSGCRAPGSGPCGAGGPVDRTCRRRQGGHGDWSVRVVGRSDEDDPVDSRQRKDIGERRRHAQDRRVYQRLSAVLWSDDGRTREEIAELLGVSTRQVGQWLRIFRNKGLEELCTLHYQGDPGRLGPAQVERLKQEIEKGVFHNAEQVRTWVEEDRGRGLLDLGHQGLPAGSGPAITRSRASSGRPMSRSRSGGCGSTGGTSVRRGRRPGGTSWTPATRSGAWTCCIPAGCWWASGSTWGWATVGSG